MVAWASGYLTNFDYLLHLNGLAGRTVDRATGFHPVLPWVHDFQTQHGGLRDLTKVRKTILGAFLCNSPPHL
jgi:hypothetical protein